MRSIFGKALKIIGRWGSILVCTLLTLGILGDLVGGWYDYTGAPVLAAVIDIVKNIVPVILGFGIIEFIGVAIYKTAENYN